MVVSWIESLHVEWQLVVFGAFIVLTLTVMGLAIGYLRNESVFLNPQKYKQATLIDKTWLSHNTMHLKFILTRGDQPLGLPIGQHIYFQAMDNEGDEIVRPYTPTTDDRYVGHVEFVIKVYPEGAMSQYLKKLQPMQRLNMKGPRGRFEYQRNMASKIGMIAGGTGITPMFQILSHALSDPKDKTQFSLVFGNVTIDDILLQKELDAMWKENPTRLAIYYVLDQPPERWMGGKGYITADIIKQHLPPPGDEVLILRCGPPPMNKALAKTLDGMGYTSEMQFQF